MAIKKGDKVLFQCESFLDDGTSLDDPEDNEPMVIEAGIDDGTFVAKTISQALVGMEYGSEKTVRLEPDEAFGQMDEDKIIAVSRDQLPGEIQLGDLIETEDENGEDVEAVVCNIDDESVSLDFNHPLAGKPISFKINAIEEA